MEFYEVIKCRRSMRGFFDKEIPDAALERIGEAVALAPSACNRQPLRFEVVLNSELRKKNLRNLPSAMAGAGSGDCGGAGRL